jgi:hypothetical protein
MGEAEAAGHVFNYDYLQDVQEKAKEILRDFRVRGQRPEDAKRYEEMLDGGIVEIILSAVQKCPSGDYILHDADGNIFNG